jgi:hypothetical protein
METLFIFLIVAGLIIGALFLTQSGFNKTDHEPVARETQDEATLRRLRIHLELQARLVKQEIRREGVQLRREIRRDIDDLEGR